MSINRIKQFLTDKSEEVEMPLCNTEMNSFALDACAGSGEVKFRAVIHIANQNHVVEFALPCDVLAGLVVKSYENEDTDIAGGE